MNNPQPTKRKVAFIGLGVMGGPMAGHLARAGHEVTVFNRTRAKAEAWLAKYPGRVVATPRDAARGAEFVFACVGNDDDVRQVTLEPHGAFSGMESSAVFVDHTTTSASVARELDVAARKMKLAFLDAPVSGGQMGAEKGTLSVMAGGDSQAFERAKPLISHYASAITLIGPAGSGQLAKMVNQICNAGILQSLAEALNFTMRAGLDTGRVLEAISKGAAKSSHMDVRGSTMIQGKFDFGFAVDWMRKDLMIALDEARRNQSELPLTALVEQFYAELQRKGYGRLDVSSLIKRLSDR
jgi:3-hydroxyisobutyrate dehydrogenase-like beta-hydroxyacid dehydrogenase